MALPGWLESDPRLRYRHHRAARPGRRTPLPPWVGGDIRTALTAAGFGQLWRHQEVAASGAWAGRHIALATGTASGKTLAYLLPILAATVQGELGHELPRRALATPRAHTAIYLAPTKALAHDQFRAARELGVDGFRVVTLDGDSTLPQRQFARDFGSYVLTNPDMVHRAVLPRHAQWARLLGGLRYIVVDEAHRYRGVFGAHVAMVLRRLRRLAAHYGAAPVVISASATAGEADQHLMRLAGVDRVVVVDGDDSARPASEVCLWQPSGDPHHEAAELLGRLVAEGRQTLAFTTSRVQAELVSLRARESVADPSLVASYRSGYLAEDRRSVERRLQSRELLGVASTNALELGVDISGVDAVLCCGFPGTRAAFWQQVGRAGRADSDALAVLIAKPDPLDAYLCEHPELLFDRPVERVVLHPENPMVQAPHLAAAAQELPLSESDSVWFGPRTAELADALASAGYLRRRAAGWYWTRPDRAVDAIDLRSAAGASIEVVDESTGRVIGQVDPAAADRTVHPGAVYLHQGEQWLVDQYLPGDHTALAHRSEATFFTQANAVRELEVLSTQHSRELASGVSAHCGEVLLRSQVTGYLRRDTASGAVWDSSPLELPQRTLATRACWWVVPAPMISQLGILARDLPGAAHAAEHASIGLLPAFAPCDRWDIGGLSTVHHSDTGSLTVFVHDGQPGGGGFADQGFQVLEEWLQATFEMVRDCPCSDGCPSCVVSPKCGNGNQPLNKGAAIQLLQVVLGGPTYVGR